MHESEKLAEQQITETILEEMDKVIDAAKRENGLSDLEIVHDYDSFAFSFLKDASQGKLKKDNVFNEIKISLASCESPFPGEKKRWIFYYEQKFKIRVEYEVKDKINRLLNTYFLEVCRDLISLSDSEDLRLHFDRHFINRIFEKVYDKSYESGSLKYYLDWFSSEYWLFFLKNLYQENNDGKKFEEWVKEYIAKNWFYFSVDEGGRYAILPLTINQPQNG